MSYQRNAFNNNSTFGVCEVDHIAIVLEHVHLLDARDLVQSHLLQGVLQTKSETQ